MKLRLKLKVMKTTVLAYSKNGVYVEVENSFASTVFDFNTATYECEESDYPWWKLDDTCTYQLSKCEIEELTEAFNLLVD